MRVLACAYTIIILFFCIGSLILFLEVDAVKEQQHSTVNIPNNQKRSRYFDEYDVDPQSNLRALEREIKATSSEQDPDKQKTKSAAEKITSFIKDVKNKVQGTTTKSFTEELEKNPFTKPDVTASQQTATLKNADSISIRILPNASKKFVAFLFVIFAIAVFSTYYVITSRKNPPQQQDRNRGLRSDLKKPNTTTVEVTDDGTIKINNNENENNIKKKKEAPVKQSVTIQDLDESDAKKNSKPSSNNNNNNIDNDEKGKEEVHNDTADPKEELHDDSANTTKESVSSKNSTTDDKKDNSVNDKSKEDAQRISPRRKVQISPRVTEPGEHHLTSDDEEDGQDPEYEEDIHETIVLSSSNSQIRAKKNSPRVHEINAEIAEHQHTIQLLEREATSENAIKIRELKMFVTDLKLRKMEIEEKMASNALSFEHVKEMQRQNKFKRKTKREEISKSTEYRSTKTMLTEKQNQIQSQNLRLKGEKNEREVTELERKREKELQEMMWNEFVFMVKVTLIIFMVFWGIHLWQTMSVSAIVSVVRQKFGEFAAYLFPSTARNLSFLNKVPVVGTLLSGAGSFMGILLLMLLFVAYAVAFWFMGPYMANTLLLTLVMLGFGAWRHVVTGGATFVTLASIEYVAVRQLKHHMNSSKYSLIYIPFVILAAVLGYFTAFNVLSVDVPIQVAAGTSVVNNVWSRVSKLVFK